MKWLIPILAIVAINACDLINCYKTYEFELPMSVYPTTDTLHIGDTLWINITIPTTLLDHASGDEIEVEDVDWQTSLGISRIDTSSWFFAYDHFLYKSVIGETYFAYPSIVPTYEVEGGFYKFTLAISPQQRGVYKIGTTTSLGTPLDTGHKCTEDMDIIYKVNSGDAYENNFDLVLAKSRFTYEFFTH